MVRRLPGRHDLSHLRPRMNCHARIPEPVLRSRTPLPNGVPEAHGRSASGRNPRGAGRRHPHARRDDAARERLPTRPRGPVSRDHVRPPVRQGRAADADAVRVSPPEALSFHAATGARHFLGLHSLGGAGSGLLGSARLRPGKPRPPRLRDVGGQGNAPLGPRGHRLRRGDRVGRCATVVLRQGGSERCLVPRDQPVESGCTSPQVACGDLSVGRVDRPLP
jgi:hypothetical protein